MDLKELRTEIDKVDDELIGLFFKRLSIAGDIALYKKQHGLPVFDPKREEEKLSALSAKVNEEYKEQIVKFFSLLFNISRAEQEKILSSGEAVQ